MPTPRPNLLEPDRAALAAAWAEVEPDAAHRAQINRALAEGEQAVAELFGSPLQFGTAGLRGPLGPGPGAMNRTLVRLVAAALGQVVLAAGGDRVVVGFDARHHSDDFALDTARVLAAAGITVSLFDRTVPTPTLAFATTLLGASAGVMVTASHNPRTDNGYKVYGADGALLGSPADRDLADRIAATPLLGDTDLAPAHDPHIERVGQALIDEYVDAVLTLLTPGGPRGATVAYTPLHGVGHPVFAQAFDRAGFTAPRVVKNQREPDADFPTTPFPNPEEPGVLRPLFEAATKAQSKLAIANDPDADRLAAAVPTTSAWRLLTGDELGCLLAEYLLSRPNDDDRPRLVMNTVVSSGLLAAIADHHGATYEQTLTGFKWIMRGRAGHPDKRFVLGYEEALGYSVGEVVPDKDGIGAALVVAEMASDLESQGRGLLDLLDELHRRHGVHVSGQRSLRFEIDGGPTSAEIMAGLRADPPSRLGDQVITSVQDLQQPGGALPPTDAIVLHLEQGRAIVRPSGTEPKLKLYGEVWRPPIAAADERAASRADAHRQLTALVDALAGALADPERAQRARVFAATAPASDTDIEARANALFAGTPRYLDRERLLRLVVDCIDLTTLAGDDTDGRVRALCAAARRPDPADATVGPTAAVCVYPNLVALAAELTQGSGVAVASVASAFPSGLSAIDVRLADIQHALDSGADEIDVVLNRAAFLQGDVDRVIAELQAMRTMIGPRSMKVILETGELGPPQAIRDASRLAIESGADWIKTSTGKSAVGATPVAVLAMAQSIAAQHDLGKPPVGLKVSGGVRTSADALGYLAIIEATLGPRWLRPDRVRFGASGLLGSVVTDLAALRP